MTVVHVALIREALKILQTWVIMDEGMHPLEPKPGNLAQKHTRLSNLQVLGLPSALGSVAPTIYGIRWVTSLPRLYEWGLKEGQWDIFFLFPCEPDLFYEIYWRFLIRHRELGPCALSPARGTAVSVLLDFVCTVSTASLLPTHLSELSTPGLKLFKLFKP